MAKQKEQKNKEEMAVDRQFETDLND